MAYPIDDDVLSLFWDDRYRQIAEITFYGTEETITLTESDIVSGGLYIDRYSASGSKIELGSAIASEMSLTLNNSDGRFNDTVFEGAEMYVKVGIKKWDAHRWEKATIHYVPLGYFTVDNSPRRLTSITLSAYDRMVLFDKTIEPTKLAFPMTVGTLLKLICNICNVELATDVGDLLNYDYTIASCPDDTDITYRQLLQWIGQITATCAYIDWEGKLRLEWYSTEPQATITASERYSSDIDESVVTVTGVKISTIDTDYLAGDDSYCFTISGNDLIQSDYADLTASIYSVVEGMSYLPYSCTTKPLPQLYPLDCITITDRKGDSYNTIVTNVNFKLNGNTVVEAIGESATSSGYATANPLTNQEATIIKTLKGVINEQLNESVQSVLNLNTAIAGALGLYQTVITNSDGSSSYYFHSNPVLSDSKEGDVIYTLVSGGFACCTTGWNGGNPVWETGFTKDGNAIFKFISTNGIEVADDDTDYSVNITPEVFEIWYRAIKIITVNADESQFTKVIFNTYAEVGKIRLLPYTVNGEVCGTNIVYVD